MTDLFENKAKKTSTIVFSALYMLLLILSVNLLPLITPAMVIIFLLTVNKEYRLKKWLLPIGFGIDFIGAFLLYYSYLEGVPLIWETAWFLLRAFLMCVGSGCMFVGALFNFKYRNLLKYGAIVCAAVCFVMLVIELTNLPTTLLMCMMQDTSFMLYLLEWMQLFTRILFYIGIFILATKPKIKTAE